MTGAGGSNLNRGEPDPFLHLHKMSTTAGLGSGDYVAINGPAVVSLLLGAASAFVLFDSHIFLLFPLVGFFMGVLAWSQIQKSNGTQTGRKVASVGLLLSVGFGGYAGVQGVYSSFRNHSDQVQIVSQLRKLGDLLKAHDYPDAYSLFDTEFQKRVTKSDFETGWRRLSATPILGDVQSIDWNQLLEFSVDPVTDNRLASGIMLLKLRPPEPMRVNMILRSEDGSWLFDQLPQLFAADGAAAAAEKKTKGSTFIGPPKP